MPRLDDPLGPVEEARLDAEATTREAQLGAFMATWERDAAARARWAGWPLRLAFERWLAEQPEGDWARGGKGARGAAKGGKDGGRG